MKLIYGIRDRDTHTYLPKLLSTTNYLLQLLCTKYTTKLQHWSYFACLYV